MRRLAVTPDWSVFDDDDDDGDADYDDKDTEGSI
jgi:hypothetical protein